MILLITLGCVIALLGWLLFTPVRLIVHSTTNEYQLRWGWLLNARLILLADDLLIRIGLPFYKKDYYPLHPSPSEQSTQETKRPRKQSRKSSLRKGGLPFKMIRSVLRSFRIRQFKLDLDTDNYLTNAYLFPLFYFLSRGKGDYQINYDGRFELHLEMDNRPIRLIRALLWQ